MLTLLTSLNLESLLQDEIEPYISELFSDEANLANLRVINERLMHWGRIRHHGPILLAWAVFHCRVGQVSQKFSASSPFRSDPAVQAYLRTVPYQTVAATAFSVHVVKFLTQSTTSLTAGSEHNLIGYLSILKQLLSATLTAFDIKIIPSTEDFIEFACQLFSNQPALCTQFWAWDANHPARGSLLQLAQSRYPYDTVSWLKLLRALACESNAAVHVLNSVQSLKTFTQALPEPPPCGAADCKRVARVELSGVGRDGELWLACDEHVGSMKEAARAALRGAAVTSNPVHVARDLVSVHPDHPELLVAQSSIYFPDDLVRLPSGTLGQLMWSSADKSVNVVCWNKVSTGWLYLVRQLELFLKPRTAAEPTQASVDRVSCILALISRLLSTNEKIASALAHVH